MYRLVAISGLCILLVSFVYSQKTFGLGIKHCDNCNNKTENCTLKEEFDIGQLYECVCNVGYERINKFCTDINECADSRVCDSNAECINTEGNYTCSCTAGFSGNGKVCYDIDECKDEKLHNCTDEGFVCANTVGGFKCDCNIGFKNETENGLHTCNNINECQLNTDKCSKNADCKDTTGSYTCTCKNGFSGDGFSCSDIDECNFDHDNCSKVSSVCTNIDGGFWCDCKDGFQKPRNNSMYICENINECQTGLSACDENSICKDTVGSFTCDCKTGFYKEGDNCKDFDECQADGQLKDKHNCSSVTSECKNTIGGFMCECRTGYKRPLISSQYICENIDGCGNRPEVCSKNANCMENKGSYTCRCREGYSGDGFNCIDVNECELNMDNCSEISSVCLNTDGGFLCNCKDGFQRSRNNNLYICENINECITGSYVCDENSICKDTEGNYTCDCNTGFYKKGDTCTDVDECQEDGRLKDKHNCSSITSECKNTNGGFMCECRTGYKRPLISSQYICENIDECKTGTHNCDINAMCTDTDGSFKCACRNGFTGDGAKCTDVDECATNEHKCFNGSSCTNNPGGYTCNCYAGFKRSLNKSLLECEDINECSYERIFRCPKNSQCVNLPGSYSCSCENGYVMEDGFCQDINECKTNQHNCSTESADCVNIDGGFKCNCKEGFELPKNRSFCVCRDAKKCQENLKNGSRSSLMVVILFETTILIFMNIL